MTKDFLFVDGRRQAHDGGEDVTRKALRRHVMLGKNVGKTIQRRSRLGHQTRRQQNISCANDAIAPTCQGRKTAEHDGAQTYWRNTLQAFGGVQDVFNTLQCPVEVSTESREIIAKFFESTTLRLYPVKMGVNLHDAKWNWLRVSFADEATYHCNIALMQACNEVFLYNGASSPKALYYLSQTFALVRRRVHDDTAVSDGTVALVLNLVIQEQVRGQMEQAAMHFQGLQRMIELRGGLEQLEGDPQLVLKICKVDISFALERGCRPVHYRDRMPDLRRLLLAQGIDGQHVLAPQQSQADLQYTRLDGIEWDLLRFCTLVNSCGKKDISALNLHDFYEINTSVWYRLLDVQSLDESLQAEVTGLLIQHLGLALFMATTFLDNVQHQIIDYQPLRSCIDHAAENLPRDLDCALTAWFLLLALIWVAEETDDGQLEHSLQHAAGRLGATTWGEARVAMSALPWLDAVHDGVGCNLWTRLCEDQ